MLTTISIKAFSIAMPEIFMALSILVLTMVGVFSKARYAFQRTYTSTLAVLIVALVLTFKLPNTTQEIFSGLFINDYLSILTKLLILSFTLYIVIVIRAPLTECGMNVFELPILLLTSTLGLMILASSNDFLSAFAGLELFSLSLYILIAMKRKNLQASEASLKYYILGALSTCLLLYGISWIYGFSGSTSFKGLDRLINGSETEATHYLLVGFSFILISMGFKIAAAPFHNWAPDVYEGAPLPILTYLATVPKFAIISFLIRLMTGPFDFMHKQWSILIVCLSAISMAIGGFVALTQQSLRRFIAYSSIGQIGFTLIGIALATEYGYQRSLFYIVFYCIALLGFMAGLLHVSRRGHELKTIKDLNGLGKHHPIVATCLGFFILSMAGLPPLPGFLPKLLMLQTAIQNEYYALTIGSIVYSVLAAAYYLLIIKAIFIDETKDDDMALATLKTNGIDLIFIFGALIALIILTLMPDHFISWIDNVIAIRTF